MINIHQFRNLPDLSVLADPGGRTDTTHGSKRRDLEWPRLPEPLPAASGMLVQPLRTATECQVDRARSRAASSNRAQTLDTEILLGALLMCT